MYLVIDVGGTKTLAGLCNDGGDIVRTKRFETPRDYKEFIDILGQTIDEITTKDSKLKGCCVAIPGLINRTNGVVYVLGNLPWKNVPIARDLNKFIGNTKVILENDARLAGLAEANVIRYSHQNVLYLTVSTGIGGALIRDSKIVKALEDTEMGHMPLMYGGKVQDWEDFASGRWVVKEFGHKAEDITDPKEWDKLGHNIAQGLAAICAVVQPEAIIFGGGVGQYADKFSDVISEYLMENLPPVVKQPQALLAASYPDDAVLRGCYLLMKQKDRSSASD